LATSFKFTVAYSDFPKTEDSNDSQYFSLVSLGLEKPIVCHGSGNTNELAHNDAAFNALKDLTMIDGGINNNTNILPPQASSMNLSMSLGISASASSSTTMNSIPPQSSAGVLPVALSLI
jgi:hypothetical protein